MIIFVTRDFILPFIQYNTIQYNPIQSRPSETPKPSVTTTRLALASTSRSTSKTAASSARPRATTSWRKFVLCRLVHSDSERCWLGCTLQQRLPYIAYLLIGNIRKLDNCFTLPTICVCSLPPANATSTFSTRYVCMNLLADG